MFFAYASRGNKLDLLSGEK